MYRDFVNKPINVEHNRDRVIGTVLSASFSEFGTDDPLTEEEVLVKKGPFNITLGGVIWRTVNSNIANVIENSGDPTSENYMKISASWELGFSEYDIVSLSGENKNIEDAEIFDDEETVEEYSKFLKSFGGSGELESGDKIYRKVKGNIIPLGIGLTETPAADVKGVAVTQDEEEEKEENETLANIHSKIEKISQNGEKDVNNHIEVRKMKIENIKDINEDSLKTLTASQISSFVEDELKRASEKFYEEKVKFEEEIENSQAKFSDLEKVHDGLRSDYDGIKEKLDTLEAERIERERQDTFDTRMASLDEVYNLDDEDRKVIAAQIKDLDDDSFASYKENLTILLRSKLRAAEEAEEVKASEKGHSEEKKEEAPKAEEVEASDPEEQNENVVEEAIDNAEKMNESIPVSAEASEPTVFEKYKQAFNLDQFDFKAGRGR
jgi:cytochrome c556